MGKPLPIYAQPLLNLDGQMNLNIKFGENCVLWNCVASYIMLPDSYLRLRMY